MATLVPVATQALSIFKTVGGVASVLGATTNLIQDRNDRSSELAIRQLRDQQNLEQKQASQKAALDRQGVIINAQKAEDERRRALKRAVARQRANFGGAGVSSNSGSSEAVLLGLFDESEEERSSRERLDALRLNTIDNNLANVKRKNTLQRTQAESRQTLTRNLKTRENAGDLLDLIF